ncbi:MAG TPA: SurA N-terminal domain-containing protein [Hyphomicrobiales bacterium]|nr:SurA N-terminal domain-containing protein [Hyphomicrobiales bacterium]
MNPIRLLARLVPVAALAVAALASASLPASAQSIVAVVNGTPITSIDVRERRAFIQLSQHKNETPRQVTDDLIDEALILNEAKRYGITASEAEVEARFAQVAQSAKLTPDQLAKALAQHGASARTFKNSIRAQLSYRTLLTRSFNPVNVVSERDVRKEMASNKSDAGKTYRYTLRQVIFVTSSKASPGEVARRKQEAEGLRNRFADCQSGPALARGLRDVAVKEPVVRDDTEFAKELRDELAHTAVGHLTKPQRIDLGIQMIAVCARRQVSGSEAERSQVLNQLADEKFKQEAKERIADLRRRAVIQYYR